MITIAYIINFLIKFFKKIINNNKNNKNNKKIIIKIINKFYIFRPLGKAVNKFVPSSKFSSEKYFLLY